MLATRTAARTVIGIWRIAPFGNTLAPFGPMVP